LSSASGEGRPENVRQHVGDEPVDLLGHVAVAAPEARLEVHDWKAELGGDHRAGGGRIDVADHHQPVRPVGQRHLLVGDHYAAGLLGMASGADAEMVIGLGQAQIGEYRVRHVDVVMLAGVDQHGLEIGSGGQRVPKRRDLHEVRARGGDQVDPGRPISIHDCPAPRGKLRGRDRRRVDKER
jgi:hypothetical protein